jgi:hypothetical protein
MATNRRSLIPYELGTGNDALTTRIYSRASLRTVRQDSVSVPAADTDSIHSFPGSVAPTCDIDLSKSISLGSCLRLAYSECVDKAWVFQSSRKRSMFVYAVEFWVQLRLLHRGSP